MSIPDVHLLATYVLELECGHRRRTAMAQRVGDKLPCLDKGDPHYMELFPITKIIHVASGNEVNSIWWSTGEHAALAAYDSATTKRRDSPATILPNSRFSTETKHAERNRWLRQVLDQRRQQRIANWVAMTDQSRPPSKR